MNESQPKNFGAVVYGVCLPEDFRRIIHKMAENENRIPSDILLDLAREGAECRRLHGERADHKRTKR